jgi:hypothetical protein
VIGWGHSRSDRCRAGTRTSIFLFFLCPGEQKKDRVDARGVCLGVFRCKKNWNFDTVTLSFVFDN